MQIEIAKKDLLYVLDLVEQGRKINKKFLKNNRHLTMESKRVKVADKMIMRLQLAITKDE